mmetsp:Transcript_32729/g.40508  ORF Transcript_32729/g.40508 Transcript_32729/m.40508 type:complete len:122 (-) Transcript_32729:36-401(-)
MLAALGGITIVLTASFLNSLVGVLSRKLQDVPYAVVLFYDSFIGSAISTLILFVATSLFDRPLYFLTFKPIENTLLFLATALSALSVICQTIAFQSGNSSFVALLSFVSIVYAMAADIIIF